jgi:hypothetical protein
MYEVLELKFKLKHKVLAACSGLLTFFAIFEALLTIEKPVFSIFALFSFFFVAVLLFFYIYFVLLCITFPFRKAMEKSSKPSQGKKIKKLLKQSTVDYDLSEEVELPPDDLTQENRDSPQPEKVLSDKETDAVYTLKDAPVLWESRVSLLKASLTPEEFFEAYDNLTDYAKEILAAESVWLSFNNSSAVSKEFLENITDVANGDCFEDELAAFIEESYEFAEAKIESKETASDKRNAARAWHASFDPYLSRMSEKEIHLLHEKYGELIMLADTSNLCSL